MTGPQRVSPLEHPLALGSFRNWLRMLHASGGIDREFLPRVPAVALSTSLTSPLRLAERVRYERAIRQTAIHPSPVFIVGHWRSGTTHLHNLLCLDHQFGYPSLFEAMAPGFSLVGERAVKPLLDKLAKRIHPTRLIDNIPLSFYAPQEEEYAVANLSPYSFLHLFTFPRRACYFFEKYVLMDGLTAQAFAEWKETYLSVLRLATVHACGKRLALKNPAHSGRLRTVLELFPDARFIHIYRNPYLVFPSMRWLYKTVLPTAQVQRISPAQADACILQFYTRLMQRFLADKGKIPRRNLVEVRFEDLETAPLDQLRRVYDALNLPGYGKAEPAFRAYLASIAGYQKNPYRQSDETIAQVNRHWGFALEAWDYPRLEPSSQRVLAEPVLQFES